MGFPDLPPPPGWKWTALSDVAQLESGHTPSRRHPEYWDGKIPWIGLKDAIDHHGGVIYDTYQHVTELGLAHSSARLLPENTVCLSRTASVGYVVVMGRSMATSQDFVNWVCGPKVDPHFLKYVLLAENEAFLRFASGTTHQTIYYPEAKAFHICLPPLEQQKSIVHALGSLDDKIELNRQMNETLEAMARAIFQSWFVDFDPVRAKAEGRQPVGMDVETAALFPDKMAEVDGREVPKGWRYTTVNEAVIINDSKRIPLSSQQRAERKGPYPYYGAASVMDYVDDYLFEGVYLLLGEDGSVINEDNTPVTQYVWGKFWVNNHAHILTGKGNISVEFLLLFFKQIDVSPYVTGAVQPKINQANLCRIPIILPDEKIVDAFTNTINPIFALIRKNIEQSRTLSQIRDALLPKLMSGDISVDTRV